MEIESEEKKIQGTDPKKRGNKSKQKENTESLKESKPKKEKIPKKEKTSSKKEKQSKKDKVNEDSEKKCKRGFKFCKNPNCDEMVHIHKKSCPKCGFEFEMKSAAKDEENDIVELEKLLKKKKVKTEAGSGIANSIEAPDMQIIKKAFYRNVYTINYAHLSANIQNLRDRIFSEEDMTENSLIYNEKDTPKIDPLTLNFHSKNKEINKVELTYNQPHQIEFENKKSWKETIINVGFPINSASWAYRGKNNKEDKIARDQYFVVSFSSSNVNKAETDENTFITLQALNWTSFHKFGTRYDNQEYIGLYKIEFDQLTMSYEHPKLLYYIEHQGGSCVEMKWLPVISSSDKEIGILGILTANGKISIYSVPCPLDGSHSKELSTKLKPLEEVSLPNIYFTQFAWYPRSPFDKFLVGDLVGNIYLFQISIQNSKCVSKWIKLYQMAHSKDIKDLKWLPSFDDDEILFASCSEDGDTKIWTLNDTCNPIYYFCPTKRPVYNLMWDLGTTYLVTNGEGPGQATKTLAFQNLKKLIRNIKEDKKIEDYVEDIELKYVASFETNLKTTNSPYSPYLVSSDIQGNLIFLRGENLRLNFIYGNKRERNDEIEILCKSNLHEENGKKFFSIKYHQEKKDEEPKKRESLPDHRIAINALELNPNNLAEELNSTNEKQITSMLLVGNYLGVLRVLYFYK